MSGILKYKGLMGANVVELELPLDLASIDKEHLKLLDTFAEWLTKKIAES